MNAPHSIARFPGRGGKSGKARSLPINDGRVQFGRTLFPTTVKSPYGEDAVLKSGANNGKIGRKVLKGRLKGLPIYTLTLEERATCPRTCLHWRGCYGNGMPFADRFEAGPALCSRILIEIEDLLRTHKQGILVRLHVLGDFYSTEYVEFWGLLLHLYKNLHVFGFTARIDTDTDPIAVALAQTVKEHGFRFAMRFSNADTPRWSTETLEMPEHAAPGTVVCPQQTGKTVACATCGFCWSSNKKLGFLRH